MADARRIKRLETLILQTVAPLVSQGLTDPRLSMVTVTRIRLSADLSVARVNWSCIGDEADRSKASHALEHARGVMQGAVAKAMQTRITPRLHFHFDEALEKALRVTQILEDLARERGDAEEDEEGEDGEAEAEDAPEDA